MGFQYLLPLPRVQIWGYELKGFAVQSGIDRLGCLGSLMLPALITIALLFMFGMLRFGTLATECLICAGEIGFG